MKSYQYSSIGRPLDPVYKTNKIIGILTPVFMVLGFIYYWAIGHSLPDSFLFGLQAGISVFLTWALARELDPDNDYSAFVALIIHLPALVWLGAPAIFNIFWFLLLTRMLNHTTGLVLKWQDSIVILLLASWLIFRVHWIIGMMTAFAFLLDSRLKPASARQLIFFVLLLVEITVYLIVWDAFFQLETVPLLSWILFIVATILFLPVIYQSARVKSLGDATAIPLNPRRVRTAQILVWLSAVLLLFIPGTGQVTSFSPVWVAFVGIGLYRLFVLARNK